ncbi:hypothetical protein D3C72_1876200 [compost metagenome]
MGMAERIEPGVAQELELGQQLEALQHPRTETAFFRFAAGAVIVQQRWRQMEAQAVIALEAGLDFFQKLSVGKQTGYFIFILDGQHFEVVTGNTRRQLAGLSEQCGFRLDELLDTIPVALGIGVVLVRSEKLHAPFQRFFQAL